MPRPMDVFMSVVSLYAQRCYQFKINPDLDELERYNAAAKKKECPHANQVTLTGDDYSYRMCNDCTETHNLPVPTKLDGKFYDEGRTRW
jgi:hypothetical protein